MGAVAWYLTVRNVVRSKNIMHFGAVDREHGDFDNWSDGGTFKEYYALWPYGSQTGMFAPRQTARRLAERTAQHPSTTQPISPAAAR